MTWNTIKQLMSSFNTGAPKDEPVQNRQEGLRTCLYYGSWSIYNNHTPQDVPFDLATHIFYSFFNIKSTGEVHLGDEWADVQKPFPSLYRKNVHVKGLLARFFESKQHNRAVKVCMSIGGWSNKDNFTKGLLAPDGLTKFVLSSTRLMLEYGFDGIDLDWEYPENHTEAQRYLDLIKGIRRHMRAIEDAKGLPRDSFLLTVACPGFEDKLELYRIKEMDPYLNFWNMMTYDYAGTWSNRTLYHCNLYNRDPYGESGDKAIKHMINQAHVAPEKLCLGMAFYGRPLANTYGFGLTFKGAPEDAKDEIYFYNKLPIAGSKEKYDSQAVVAYCWSESRLVFVSYDNLRSISVKAKYVLDNGLGGGMFWESQGDRVRDPNASLLRRFVTEIGDVEALDASGNLIDCYDESEYLHTVIKMHNVARA